jgi:hypothetical protein
VRGSGLMWVRGIALAGMGQWCGWWAGADLWSAGIPARLGGVVLYVVIAKTVIPYCMKCRSKENATLTPSRSITEKLTASVKEKSLSL